MRSLASYMAAFAGVAAVAWLTSATYPTLGLASSALLFLVPVLVTAARGGVGPAIFAAMLGAAAYNFFLLPPRFTFQVHGVDNVTSVVVLLAVALVTSRLATRLKLREAEAQERARNSNELAELSAILASHPASTALERGLALLSARYGQLRLVESERLAQPEAAFTSLDLAAAAWSHHNGDQTGHGTGIMPAADWTFLPLAAANRSEEAIAALARPADGTTRSAADLEHLAQACRLIGQARDRDALEAERHAREILAETDRLRRTMLAALAHDFRTPLTVITGRLGLIAPESQDAAEALGSARQLERMMDDLIGAARIESGSLDPHFESIDIIDAITSAIEPFKRLPGVEIDTAIADNLPFVVADPVLLHHVLVNLLDNAVRHARRVVSIGALSREGALVLCVQDDGPGIPVAERERVFERFARIEGADTNHGSGLGLAIVRGFVQAMGMTVSVTDGPGGGARFEVTLLPVKDALG